MMLASGLGFGSTGAIARSIDADVWQIASWRSLLGGSAVLIYVWLRGRIGRAGAAAAQRPSGHPSGSGSFGRGRGQ